MNFYCGTLAAAAAAAAAAALKVIVVAVVVMVESLLFLRFFSKFDAYIYKEKFLIF